MDEVVDPADADDAEHTSAFVRYGFDDGRMYVLTYNTSRRLTFEQWADQDFESELAPAGFLSDVPPTDAARLMLELGAGGVERLKQHAWTAGK